MARCRWRRWATATSRRRRRARRRWPFSSSCWGIIFFGVLIGSLTQLLQRASKDARKAQLYREKMESVEGWLRGRRFPARLRVSSSPPRQPVLTRATRRLSLVPIVPDRAVESNCFC